MITEQTPFRYLYRIYGIQSPRDLDPVALAGFADRFVLLTTTDYPKRHIRTLRSSGFTVLPPTLNAREAGVHAGNMLNQGLRYMRDSGDKYAVCMSSGFQGSTGIIHTMFRRAFTEYPDKDVYFVVTPSVQRAIRNVGNDSSFPIYENRQNFFPSESLAAIRLQTVFPLNDSLSAKGALGHMKDGTPLGGLELLMTSMNRSVLRQPVTFDMCAILHPFERGSIAAVYKEKHNTFSMTRIAKTVEFTDTPIKLHRRRATIDAAIQQLGMTRGQFRNLYTNTIVVNGFDLIFP